MYPSVMEPDESYSMILEAKDNADRLRAHFKKFTDHISVYESSTEDLKPAEFVTTPGKDFVEVATSSHRTRFSLALRLSAVDDSLFGQVIVHRMPDHDGFEAPTEVSRFNFDKHGSVNVLRNGRQLTFGSWQQSTTLMTHYHAMALRVQPNPPVSL